MSVPPLSTLNTCRYLRKWDEKKKIARYLQLYAHPKGDYMTNFKTSSFKKRLKTANKANGIL